jgi:hypothetical protein
MKFLACLAALAVLACRSNPARPPAELSLRVAGFVKASGIT